MADPTPNRTPPPPAPPTPPAQPPAAAIPPVPGAKVPLTDDQKAARASARKELRAMHAVDRKAKDFDPRSFDDKRFHALHYLAAGQAVPSIDPDDLD